jgi:hypothetical protein
MSFHLKWSFNNEKVSKLDAVSFGIPAFESADGFKTCPKAGACAAICYARQGHYRMPNVVEAREFNLRIVRGDLDRFVAMAVEDLKKIPNRTIRVHDSGDFFSEDYLRAWYKIARAFPEKRFYSYTKSLHLKLWVNRPANFQVIQSEGGQLDPAIREERPHARIFATNYARRKAGYGDGHMTDTLAIQGANKIGLVYHGNKNLTEAQDKYFR